MGERRPYIELPFTTYAQDAAGSISTIIASAGMSADETQGANERRSNLRGCIHVQASRLHLFSLRTTVRMIGAP